MRFPDGGIAPTLLCALLLSAPALGESMLDSDAALEPVQAWDLGQLPPACVAPASLHIALRAAERYRPYADPGLYPLGGDRPQAEVASGTADTWGRPAGAPLASALGASSPASFGSFAYELGQDRAMSGDAGIESKVAVPVPEPASLTLLALGLAGLVRRMAGSRLA